MVGLVESLEDGEKDVPAESEDVDGDVDASEDDLDLDEPDLEGEPTEDGPEPDSAEDAWKMEDVPRPHLVR